MMKTMDAKTIATYDSMAKEYDDETADFWNQFPVGFIETFTQHVAGKNILDVGSGPGRDALLLQEAGFTITCLDASRSMVEITKSKGLKSVQADMLEIPFGDDVFDGVWAYTSLIHLKKEELPRALAEIRRVLKQHGVLGLGVIEGEGERYRFSAGINKPRWFAFFEKSEIEDILKTNGFVIESFQEFKPGSKRYLNYVAIVEDGSK